MRLRWMLWTILAFLTSSFVVSACAPYVQATGAQQTAAAQISTCPGSINVEPGMLVERDFGSLTLVIRVDKQLARVDVDVKLDGRLMTQRTLTPDENVTVLDLVNGDVALRGSFAARFAYPQERSSLIGDFKVIARQSEFPFQGDIVAWQSPEALVLDRQTVWITPELRVESDILLDESQSVQITFFTRSQTIHTLTLSQGANSAVVNRDFTVGAVQIESGMSLQLQPATPTQGGEVYLKGTFASSSLPKIDYAGAIATWSYVQPPTIQRSDE